jgi:hypothetical protein
MDFSNIFIVILAHLALIGEAIGHNLKANTTWYIAQIISIWPNGFRGEDF